MVNPMTFNEQPPVKKIVDVINVIMNDQQAAADFTFSSIPYFKLNRQIFSIFFEMEITLETELRKLTPSVSLQLSQLLECNDGWKKVMTAIPKESNHLLPKYTAEHLKLVENECIKTGRLGGEILLEEWSTSGRKRPTVGKLLDLLKQCHLFRAADYIAVDLLKNSTPLQRPDYGPARKINEDELNSHLRGIDFDIKFLKNEITEVSFEQIETTTKQFSIKLGEGAFSVVYKGTNSENFSYAVKVLKEEVNNNFVNELKQLREYKHENLVQLLGFCSKGPTQCLIYEFMEGGSLLDALKKRNKPLTWVQRLNILQGILRALVYLHTSLKPLVHRDVKSANVLLSLDLKAKLGDFGLAKHLNKSGQSQTTMLTSTILGTSAYMAPEAFRGDVSPKIDVFAFGVIILEIITGEAPFDENRAEGNDIVTFVEESIENDDIMQLIDPSLTPITEEQQVISLYELGNKCLSDKRNRLTSSQALDVFTTIKS